MRKLRLLRPLLERAEAAQTAGKIAVLAVAMSGTAHLNHCLGHAAVDELLAELAGRLADAVPDGTVARVGGDVFACVWPLTDDSASSAERAESRAVEVLRRLALPLKSTRQVSDAELNQVSWHPVVDALPTGQVLWPARALLVLSAAVEPAAGVAAWLAQQDLADEIYRRGVALGSMAVVQLS